MLGNRAGEFGVGSECRTYGARIIFHRYPSPSGLGYVWTAGPPGLDEYWVAHFVVTAHLLTGKGKQEKS